MRIEHAVLALIAVAVPAVALAHGVPDVDTSTPTTTATTTTTTTETTTGTGTGTAPPIVTAPASTSQGQSADSFYAANTWDLDIEGGAGRFFSDNAQTFGFGRVRAGILFARWPLFWAIGATYEFSNLSHATFGVQVEGIHLGSGIWVQAGGMLDYKAQAGGMLSVGWSLLGIEAQYRGYEDYGYAPALLAKVRIPVGIIVYALGRSHH